VPHLQIDGSEFNTSDKANFGAASGHIDEEWGSKIVLAED
jgi:hypothetical protein